MISTWRVLNPCEPNHSASASSDFVNGILPTNSLFKRHLQSDYVKREIRNGIDTSPTVCRTCHLDDFERGGLPEAREDFCHVPGAHVCSQDLREHGPEICRQGQIAAFVE